MRQVNRVLLLVVLALFASFGEALTARAQSLPAPSAPILVVNDSTQSDPYQNYVPELMTTEGLNEFQIAQLPQLTASFLSNYNVVVLPHLTLTSAEATLFQNYVSAGGVLVGFRPDTQLATMFGVAPTGGTLPEDWVSIDTTSAYASGLSSSVMKFHGTADLYTLGSGTKLATLYSTPTTATTNPAVVTNQFGSGRAILFAYDLTATVVLMRQGNPAWAGYPNSHDGSTTMRASQMFMDQPTGKYWNDLGNGALNDVPQADEQMRLFSNAVVVTNAAKLPLPRFWYFPNQQRALLLMTGDHHGDAASNSNSEEGIIHSFGGAFSEFMWAPYNVISPTMATSFQTAGDALGIHFNDTAETDSTGIGGAKVTWNGMQAVISNSMIGFASTYPTAPAPVTTRNHYLIWLSSNASGAPDPIAQAKLFQSFGVQMDTTFSSFPNRWGYMTGSGLPMKFLDTTAGTVVPVYEQATQYEDDVQLSGDTYSMQWTLAQAQSHYQQSLSDSLTKYNTVVTMLFHPDHWVGINADGGPYQAYAQSVLQYAQTSGVPMSTTASWLSFWQARTATAVSNPAFSSHVLTFTAAGAPAGLTLLVPNSSGTTSVSAMSVDGAAQPFTTGVYQGVTYATVVLGAGTHAISVTYANSGVATITGQVTPASAAASTTMQLQTGGPGGPIVQTTQPAANGNYSFGPLPAGTYVVTAVSPANSFSPAAATISLATTNVTGVNFAAAVLANGETLLTTQTPSAVNLADGPYELGTVFQSDVTGNITAVRFWKDSNETGPHTGRVWSSTGQLLAQVAFSNETASGWQQQLLLTPIQIAANTSYIVSVNSANSYVASAGGFTAQIVNQDLSSVLGNNGLFGASGTFPTNSFNNGNYFRDVVFVPTAFSISGTISPAALGSGATVNLSGAASATTTANASGNFTFSNVPKGTYLVAPSSVGMVFTPASQAATVTAGSISGMNFNAAQTYSIAGSITPASLGSGATITLTGSGSASTTADANGNFTFSGLVAGAYTVTASKTAVVFSPSSQSVSITTANGSASFTATQTFSISGTVSPAATGSGTTITLSGAASATATADTNGNYTIGNLPAGSYTITPSKSGVTFSPASLSATITTANSTGNNFAVIQKFSIAGTITPAASGTGSTVTLSGAASATTTADASGNYSFTGLLNGTYTVTPSKTGLAFTPVNKAVTISGANVTAINFTTATAVTTETLLTTQVPATLNNSDGPGANYELGMKFTSGVAGKITAIRFYKGTSESGTHTGHIWSSTGTVLATVTFTGESASGWQQQALTTALSISANTTYVVSVNTGNTFYDATDTGFATQIVNNDLKSVVGGNGVYGTAGAFPSNTYQSSNYFRDIVMTPPAIVPTTTYALSGTISPAISGNGATLTISGAANGTATADSNGNFSYSGLPNGTYIVTPSKAATNFTPASITVTINNANSAANNFTASGTTYTITGSITPAANGTGATVTLSGAGTATATADVNGNYSFPGVANGAYTITPSKAGFIFAPVSASVTVNGANAAASAMAATPVFTLSGTISPAASGTGATVVLSGPSSASTTADANGNYSFAGLVNGNYTVAPSKSGIAFTPASLAVAVSGANSTGNNFTAGQVFSISGSITPAASGAGASIALTGTSTAVATADANGNYTFTGLANGSYTATPTKAGFTFNPISGSATINGANTTIAAFAATQVYTISGTVAPAASGAGTTLTLSGPSSGTTTADLNGNYSFTVSLNGSYTIAPAKTGALFNPSSQSVTVNNASVIANFTASQTYTITGAVTPAANGASATVNLSGTAVASTTADANGNYTFSGLADGPYTVTPVKAGIVMTPASSSVTVAGANVVVNFTSVQGFSISGTISPIFGGAGTTVSLTGAAIASTQADANGNYSFIGLLNGSYSVSPVSNAFTFAPASTPVVIASANIAGINFVATSTAGGETLFTTQTPAGSFSDGSSTNYELGTAFTTDVQGKITALRFWKSASESGTHVGNLWSAAGQLLASVTFTNETLSGWQQQALPAPVAIAASSTYIVSVNTGNTYYVATTGGLAGQIVNQDLSSVLGSNGVAGAPGSFPTTNLSNTNYFRDMVFVPTAFPISGTVANGAGTSLALSGAASGAAVADANGNFTFAPVPNGTYTITPSQAGFIFSPVSKSVTVTNGAVSGVAFTATPVFIISGNVANGTGTTITLSGAASATTTTDANGNYTFANLLAGSYTLVPSKAGFVFTPTSTNLTLSTANATANFTAAQVFTLSGTITSAANGNGATVTLSGAASATTTANASGAYSFTGLLPGSYTVTPAKSGFTFNPGSSNVTISTANATANFTAAQMFTISGAITPAANGTGATVTLSGAASATTTANASGNYSFTVAAGSYTVTPSKAGFAFTPASTNVTVSTANVTANFTAASSTGQTLLTTQVPATLNNSDGPTVNYELGMKFTSTVPGKITAIRFYKGTSESGTHTGHIWSSTGTLLATVTFTGESASGWQQQALTTALTITANTTYVVSVNTGASFYDATDTGFATQIVNGNLKSVVGANGVYGNAGAFPNNTYQSSNYFRDIVFTAN